MLLRPLASILAAASLAAVVLLACAPAPAEAFRPSPLRPSQRFCRGGEVARKAEKGAAAPPAARQPWDVFRFVRQSSRFVSFPNPLRRLSGARVVRPGDVIWCPAASSSSPERNPFRWAPLDDVVMGGASSSNIDDGTGRWSGTVTDANSGGFVGVRSTPFSVSLDMRGCRGVELRLKGGEGRRFKAVVRDDPAFNGVCWTTSFDAPKGGEEGVVRLPFADQVPTIFARTVPGRTFQSENVMGFQLAYSKFEYDGDLNPNFSLGDFSVEVLELRAY